MKDMDGINLQVMVNLSGGYGDRLEKAVARHEGPLQGPLRRVRQYRFQQYRRSRLYSQRAAAQLEQDINNGAQGLKIFKNFGMDLKDTKGQRIHVDDPRFDQCLRLCGEPRSRF